ncbi:MAG TPA: Dot/Icm type IV secretion system ATPase DotB [Coxiellaceae bacterium]|nr:Dot/Icm type IV secretion system ATPase DotB [Coxiellaceae bacterium]
MTRELDSYLMPDESPRFEPKNLDELLVYSNKANASDITVQTGYPIMAEIYGRLYPLTRRRLSNTEVGELLNAVYGPNGTLQVMRGEDVDTHYEIRPTRNERYRYRVNGTGCHVDGHEGLQITFRTIPSTPPPIAELNLPPAVLEAIAPDDGVVYVTGSTGSGKSTLLASIIRSIAEDPQSNRKILTYEAPIEFVYDSIETPTAIISQSEIPRNLPSFAAGVRNALRRKPRLILVGESRDADTISAVLEAAMTGHPVYTTLHSNGVPETIRRLVGSFPEEERLGKTIDIIETMRLIIWQRLVPSVDGKRVALREYLVFTEQLRDRLLDSNPEQVTATTRSLLNEYGQSMQVDVENKFKEGVISERTYKLLMAQSAPK